MRERIVGCLEQGGSKILRSQKHTNRSRRHLHSAFWAHGAGNINLPGWWMLFLQTAESENAAKPSKREKKEETHSINRLSGIFLEFLYPLRTRALIRRINQSTSAHREASLASQHQARTFTSLAEDFIEGSPRGLQALVQENTDTARPESDAELKDQAEFRLRSLLQSEKAGKHGDEIWQLHKELVERFEVNDPHTSNQIFFHLSSSRRRVDLERSLAIFQTIHEGALEAARDEGASNYVTQYNAAIKSALKLQDIDLAFMYLKTALEANPSSHDRETAMVFGAAVRSQVWQIAIEIWHRFQQSELIYRTSMHRLWNHVEAKVTCAEQAQRALSALKFTASLELPIGSETRMAASAFANALVERVLDADEVVNDVNCYESILSEVASTAGPRLMTYQEAMFYKLQSIDDIAFDEASMRVYENLRAWTTFQPSTLLLNVAFKLAYRTQSAACTRMLLDDYRRFDVDLSGQGYVLAAETLAHSGESDALESLIQAFQERFELEQDPEVNRCRQYIINFMIYVHFKRGDIASLMEAYKDLQVRFQFAPNAVTYNFLIQGCARAGNFDKALEWFEQMEINSLQPNVETFGAIMSLFAKRGDMDMVLSLYDEVQHQGLKPDVPIINALVTGYLAINDRGKAIELVEEAMKMDLKGSRTFMWNSLLESMALSNNIEKFYSIHRRMREAGVPEDDRTYAAMCWCLGTAGRPSAALQVLKEVVPRMKIRKTSLQYGIVMNAFLNADRSSRVEDIYKDMLAERVVPNGDVYNVLLRAAARQDELKGTSNGPQFVRARRIFDMASRTLSPTSFAISNPRLFLSGDSLTEAYFSYPYEYMVYLYGTRGMFDKVVEIFDQWRDNSKIFNFERLDEAPPVRMLSALMAAYRRAQEHEEVERCWSLALERLQSMTRRYGADLNEPGWVLKARRFDINAPFAQYMTYLSEENRFDDLIHTVRGLEWAGYELPNSELNKYIVHLASSPRAEHQYLAFELCERELMPWWVRWENSSNRTVQKSKDTQAATVVRYFRLRMYRTLLRPGTRYPSLKTIGRLSVAYLDARSGGWIPEGDISRDRLSKSAPRLLSAIRRLPFNIDSDTGALG